jgi:hypothetical protein
MKKKHIHLRTDSFPGKVLQNGQTILIAENSNGKSIIRSDQKLCMVAELSREIIAKNYHKNTSISHSKHSSTFKKLLNGFILIK